MRGESELRCEYITVPVQYDCSVYTMFSVQIRRPVSILTARQLYGRKALQLAFGFNIEPYGFTRVQLACNMLRYNYYARTYRPIQSQYLALRFTRLYALRMYVLGLIQLRHLTHTHRPGT